MPTQLGEGMTGSRTNPALPRRNLRHHGLEKARDRTVAPLIFRDPQTACAGRLSVKTVRPRYAAGAPS